MMKTELKAELGVSNVKEIFLFFGLLVYQKGIALSKMEAEPLALSMAMDDLIPFK